MFVTATVYVIAQLKGSEPNELTHEILICPPPIHFYIGRGVWYGLEKFHSTLPTIDP